MKDFFIEKMSSCVMTKATIDQAINYFSANGWNLSSNPVNCNMVVLTNCVIHPAQDKQLRVFIKKYKKLGIKLIMVIGCFIDKQKMEQKYPEVLFVGIKELGKIDGIFKLKKKINKVGCGNNTIDKDSSKIFVHDKHQVIISRGCIGQCSYCNIKKAIGNPLSKAKEDIIYEINKYALSKGQTLTLLSDDIAGYGADIKTDFFELIDVIIKKYPDIKFGLLHINPNYIINNFAKFKKLFSQKKIEGISIPMQSASKRIIRLMNRPYDPEEAIKKIMQLKKISPETVFITHLLIGFPTETRKEFMESLGIIKNFSKTFINYYNRFPGTLSAKMNDLSRAELRYRLNCVLKLKKKASKDCVIEVINDKI